MTPSPRSLPRFSVPEYWRHASNNQGARTLNGLHLLKLISPFTKDLSAGAATSIVCATHPHLEEIAGRYFSDGRPKAASAEARTAALGSILAPPPVTPQNTDGPRVRGPAIEWDHRMHRRE